MTRLLNRIGLPIVFIAALFALWITYGQRISQQVSQAAYSMVNAAAAPAPNPWSDPSQLPKVQPASGAILLAGFGTLTWTCLPNENKLFYTYKPLDPSQNGWNWKEVGNAGQHFGDKNCLQRNWFSFKIALDELDDFINDPTGTFFNVIHAWWSGAP